MEKLEKKMYVASIINRMEMLILHLKNSYVFKSAVRDVVKHAFDVIETTRKLSDSPELGNIKFALKDMHKYVFSPKERGEKAKIDYINKIYIMLRDYDMSQALIFFDQTLETICVETGVETGVETKGKN